MNVLLAVASTGPAYGGPARTVTALAEALASHAVHVALWAPDGSAPGSPFFAPDTFVNRPVGRASEVLDAGPVQLVHDNGIWLPYNHALTQGARRRGIPYVVSVRGMLQPRALAHRAWKKQIAWALYQRRDLKGAAVLHVTSDAEAESVRRRGLRNPLAVVPNGVTVPARLPARADGAPRRALFLSRLHPIKGLPLLLDAWAATRPADWELCVAGPDEIGHRAQLEAQVRRLGLADVVAFGGEVSDGEKWTLYRSADLFVLPTRSENFGLVVAEALAAEVPVLTTRGAPWADLETHRCGWWVGANAEAIAEGLRRATALERPALHEMGRRGRRLVEASYTWAGAAATMAEVYAWVLEGAPPRSAPPGVRLG